MAIYVEELLLEVIDVNTGGDEDEIFDDIMCELTELQKCQTDCKEGLTTLINKLEKYPKLCPYIWVFMVLYPDLLSRFLQTREYVNAREYGSAIARCVQHHKKAVTEKDNWYEYSLKYLLEHKAKVNGVIELKILPGMYPVDKLMYRKVRDKGISDPHYDNSKLEYQYRSIDTLKKIGQYVGHRDCYHALSFGDKLLINKYIKYIREFDDCTGEAFRHFVGVPKSQDLSNTISLYLAGDKYPMKK